MTSTWSLTRSEAYSEVRSLFRLNCRYSTVRFWPSTNPQRCNSSNRNGIASRGNGAKHPRRYVRPGSCASAANGHATLAPISAMNSRRLIVSPPCRSVSLPSRLAFFRRVQAIARAGDAGGSQRTSPSCRGCGGNGFALSLATVTQRQFRHGCRVASGPGRSMAPIRATQQLQSSVSISSASSRPMPPRPRMDLLRPRPAVAHDAFHDLERNREK